MYIEAEAWATNFKHKLASGSVVFTPGMAHAEFFGRALVPGVHHVPIGVKHMCEELVDKVKFCPHTPLCIRTPQLSCYGGPL